MNLPIKAICEKRFTRKDGTCLIYIQYCYSPEKRTLLNTKISIPPNYWNRKKACISEKLPNQFGIVKILNDKLRDIIKNVEDLIIYATKNVLSIGKFVKANFTSDLEINSLAIDIQDKRCNEINLGIYHQI